MTGRSLDSFLGRALLGDRLATIVSAFGGGTGVTTYAENIGVMAATKVYSTLLFVVAAIISVLLGFSPKFGALILSIPGAVIGGLMIVLAGSIAAMAGRIWVENRVDFSNPRNLITVAAALTAGAGDLTLKFGAFTMGGIGTATFGAIILYQILAWSDAMEQHPGHGRAAAGGAGQNRPSTGVTSRSPVPPPMSRAARPLSRTVHADYPPTEFASRSRLSVLGQSPSIQRIRLTYDALDNEAGAATFPLRTSDVIITG